MRIRRLILLRYCQRDIDLHIGAKHILIGKSLSWHQKLLLYLLNGRYLLLLAI